LLYGLSPARGRGPSEEARAEMMREKAVVIQDIVRRLVEP